MIYGSVCSGIEAATAAWHPLGWKPAFFSEIEPFPRAVLSHHYPDTPLHGDFTTIGADEYGPIDLLVGGTPCQSFSIAGLRGGLDDDRGNLALEFLRLADRKRPRWLVWENVPGVLSSNGGRDFGAILGGMVELGYGFAYRVLDAQHFGVPQRRRRVFVVGHLGNWQRAAAVLFERHSLSGHPAPRREKGKVAPTIPSRSSAGGGLGTDFDCDGGLIERDWPADIAPTLNAAFGSKLGLEDQHIRGGAECSSLPEVANTLTRRMHKGINTTCDEGQTLIPTHGGGFDDLGTTHTLRGEGFDASEDGTGRGTPLVPVAFAENTRDEVRMVGGDGQIVGALAAEAGMKQTSYVAFTAKDYGADAMDDLSPTLRAGGHHGSQQNGGVMPAVAYAIQERAVSENPNAGPDGAGFRDDGAAYTLEARTVPQAVAFALRGREGGAMPEIEGDQVGALRAADGGSSRSYIAASAVRRLTPVECERLQGFPDNYTAIPWRKKPAEECPDGPRYKALGNSMAVPVMRWIGERIQMIEDMP